MARLTVLAVSVAFLGAGVSLSPGVAAEKLGKHQEHTQVSLGVRTTLVADSGYDVFSEEDILVQGSLGASHTLFAEGDWSLAGAFGFDSGASSADARGQETEFHSLRLSLAPEARFHLIPRLYFLGRVGPTGTYSSFQLYDEAAQADLTGGNWRFGFDAALGAAFQVIGRPAGANSIPRGWIQAELGYGWSGAHEVRLSPEGEEVDNAPQRVADVELPEMAVRGINVKLAVAVSF